MKIVVAKCRDWCPRKSDTRRGRQECPSAQIVRPRSAAFGDLSSDGREHRKTGAQWAIEDNGYQQESDLSLQPEIRV